MKGLSSWISTINPNLPGPKCLISSVDWLEAESLLSILKESNISKTPRRNYPKSECYNKNIDIMLVPEFRTDDLIIAAEVCISRSKRGEGSLSTWRNEKTEEVKTMKTRKISVLYAIYVILQ